MNDSSRANSYVHIVNPEGHNDVIRYDVFVHQLFKADTESMMAMHAVLGVCGEAGELADAVKKHIIYNKPLDTANLIEELGDLRFYIQAIMNLYGINEETIMQANANKLSTRYKGLRYSDAAAQERADKK